MILFNIQSYQYLAEEISSLGGIELGKVERKTFGDGEFYHRIETSVENRNIVVLGGTVSNDDTLELYDIASSAVHYGAASLTLVIPYFGYSTMERSSRIGEAIKAKYRAKMFSSLPSSPRGIRVFLFDLHSEGIPYYFENDIRPFHIYLKQLVIQECLKLCPNKDFVLASVDAGRAKWVESLARELDVTPAYILKRRSGEKTSVVSINADVDGKKVIIYDDMIRSGSSTIKAAHRYHKAGAREIHVITSHGLFTGDCSKKLDNDPVINSVVSTDSHPNSTKVNCSKLKVVSIASIVNSKLTEHIY
jgi:ribose-phosphate pyrophosphokinase